MATEKVSFEIHTGPVRSDTAVKITRENYERCISPGVSRYDAYTLVVDGRRYRITRSNYGVSVCISVFDMQTLKQSHYFTRPVAR